MFGAFWADGRMSFDGSHSLPCDEDNACYSFFRGAKLGFMRHIYLSFKVFWRQFVHYIIYFFVILSKTSKEG